MLARTQKEIGNLVKGNQLAVRYVTNEMHVIGTERSGEVVERREIPFESRVGANDDKARSSVELLVGVKESDQILDLLVGNDSPHEQNVRPGIVELAGEPSVWLTIEVRKVGHDRQHRGPWKAQLLQVLPVEFRIAQRQVATIHVGPQFPPPAETLPSKRPVDANEILGRSDVVIDERHPVGQRECRPRSLGAQRKVVE